jgi:glycerophosphoryl diester phosphodiesterase
MEFLCHRGLWSARSDQNSLAALTGALARGFGLETDVRDRDGDLVISHDPPTGPCPTLAELLDAYQAMNAQGLLALNIKADGLATSLAAQLADRGISEYFVFDMSIPEAVRCRAAGLTAYQRASEYEQPTARLPAAGLWVDAFEGTWFGMAQIEALAGQAPALAFVSPELHGRADNRAAWALLREAEAGLPATRFLLCTDEPDLAATFFTRS